MGGFWDPLGVAAKADENTLKRYREAEVTHGRVAMLAALGLLVGEAVEGSSFLFNASYKTPGQLNDSYYPGDIGFDPLGIKPEDPEELDLMITRELQNGRLAMIAAAGMITQEVVDGLGIFEHFRVSMIESANFGL